MNNTCNEIQPYNIEPTATNQENPTKNLAQLKPAIFKLIVMDKTKFLTTSAKKKTQAIPTENLAKTADIMKDFLDA